MSSIREIALAKAIGGGGGGGGGEFYGDFYDWINLNGNVFELPVKLNADYTITVTFDVQSYTNNVAIIGSSGGANRLHLTMYGNKWYTSSGDGEASFGDLSSVLGKHTFVNNYDGGNWFDGAKVTEFAPTTTTASLYINGRSGASPGNNWRLYEYKIESISTGETLYDYVPFAVWHGENLVAGGLYERVNGASHLINNALFGNDD